MAILRPENMNFSGKNLIMIISGLPGTGKTTLALSAPDVLLIDTDKGMARVNPAHRKDASICATYEEVLADLKAAEGQYKTIVIDTCGKLIDYMKDWVVRHPEMFRVRSACTKLRINFMHTAQTIPNSPGDALYILYANIQVSESIRTIHHSRQRKCDLQILPPMYFLRGHFYPFRRSPVTTPGINQKRY